MAEIDKPTADEIRRVVKTLRENGFAVVPIEPTEEMIRAGWIDKEDVNPDDIYRAMLAVASSPSTP